MKGNLDVLIWSKVVLHLKAPIHNTAKIFLSFNKINLQLIENKRVLEQINCPSV